MTEWSAIQAVMVRLIDKMRRPRIGMSLAYILENPLNAKKKVAVINTRSVDVVTYCKPLVCYKFPYRLKRNLMKIHKF